MILFCEVHEWLRRGGLYEKDTHVTEILEFYLMLLLIPPKLGDTIEKKASCPPI
jgi:hypothetical protein